MEENLYIYPTTKGRMIFGALVIIGILVLIFLNLFIQSIDELQADIEYLNSTSLTLSVTSILFSLVFAGLSLRKGKKTIKIGQFPPPGTLVFIKTKIRYGKFALWQGVGCYILGVVYLLLASFFVYLTLSIYE